MSLNWDASKVAESVRKGTRYDEKGEPYEGISLITEALVWGSLMTGIGTITTANAGEVFARFSLYETLNGVLIREGVTDETGAWTGEHKDRPITAQDVIDHVGLKTNASFRDETRAAWVKRLVGDRMDNDARTVKRALAAALVTA